MSRLTVVTASTDLVRAWPCLKSWGDVDVVLVVNGPRAEMPVSAQPRGWTVLRHNDYLGTVPAFKAGTDFVLEHMPEADVIACIHDDLELLDFKWVEKVLDRFDRQPECGLLGFGGAIGLGDADIYQKPYQPVQLARVGFRSNLVDAEVHGARSLLAERVACLDGFSQIGRRAFWKGMKAHYPGNIITGVDAMQGGDPWGVLQRLGVMHHGYDGMLGCLAARYNWECWYLPVRCRHYGGATAVGDAGYQQWAQQQTDGGDHAFWEQAHKIWYANFKTELPLRV